MRKLIVAAAFLISLSFAGTVLACENCAEYFDWQVGDTCWFCREANCGSFQCTIEEYAPGSEWCVLAGEDQCYTLGTSRHCPQEPRDVTAKSPDKQWRLAKARVYSPKARVARG